VLKKKKTGASSAPRGVEVELRELRIELAGPRVANAELRVQLTADHDGKIRGPLR